MLGLFCVCVKAVEHPVCVLTGVSSQPAGQVTAQKGLLGKAGTQQPGSSRGRVGLRRPGEPRRARAGQGPAGTEARAGRGEEEEGQGRPHVGRQGQTLEGPAGSACPGAGETGRTLPQQSGTSFTEGLGTETQ